MTLTESIRAGEHTPLTSHLGFQTSWRPLDLTVFGASTDDLSAVLSRADELEVGDRFTTVVVSVTRELASVIAQGCRIDVTGARGEFSATRGELSVIKVVEDLERRTGLPTEAVLAAANIKKRTFYGWKQTRGRKPRLSSQGQLWRVTQFVDDIEGLADDARWLGRPDRRKMFEARKFDELLAMAEDEVMGPALPSPTWSYYVADDRNLVDINPIAGRSD